MTTSLRRTRSLAAVLATALLCTVSACGGDEKLKAPPKQETLAAPAPLRPGSDIAKITQRSMRNIDSLRVHAVVLDRGAMITTDMRVTRNGECAASFSERNGVKGKVVALDEAVYLYGNRTYWNIGAEQEDIPDHVIDQVVDRWMKFPPSSEFDGLCPWDRLQKVFMRGFRGQVSVGPNTQYAGRPAIELIFESDGTSVTVEAERPHRILALNGGDDLDADAKFSAYEVKEPVQAPPNATSIYDLRF